MGDYHVKGANDSRGLVCELGRDPNLLLTVHAIRTTTSAQQVNQYNSRQCRVTENKSTIGRAVAKSKREFVCVSGSLRILCTFW
jgi:hypothetical protein